MKIKTINIYISIYINNNSFYYYFLNYGSYLQDTGNVKLHIVKGACDSIWVHFMEQQKTQ